MAQKVAIKREQSQTRLNSAECEQARPQVKTEQKEQASKRIALLVRTMVNGYSVDLEREGYMYYDVQSLLEGLFVHVGMNRIGAMTKEEIKTMVEAVKDGSAIKKLQAEVNDLKAVIDEQKKQIREQKRVIKDLKKELNIDE